MTNLNFTLTRTLARELRAGDEILVTRLDHDANVSPWLELAKDAGVDVRLVDFDPEDGSLDRADLERQLTDRTRVVAFPFASNALGTVVNAVHYAPHGRTDVATVGADVLLCSPYKFFGPHLGLAFVRRELLDRWRPYKVRPAPGYETGTAQHELLAGFVACVDYLDSVGWAELSRHERELGQRFLDGLPPNVTLYGSPTMDGRVPTFAFNLEGRAPAEVAAHLGERGIFVWHGNYYAVEVMRRLGLDEGAVRVGFVHYNTTDEVERLLEELRRL